MVQEEGAVEEDWLILSGEGRRSLEEAEAEEEEDEFCLEREKGWWLLVKGEGEGGVEGLEEGMFVEPKESSFLDLRITE